MEHKSVLTKIEEMLENDKADALSRAEKALTSGALDLDSYEDNYLLPKIILSAIYSELAYQRRPHSKCDQETIDNLKLCV